MSVYFRFGGIVRRNQLGGGGCLTGIAPVACGDVTPSLSACRIKHIDSRPNHCPTCRQGEGKSGGGDKRTFRTLGINERRPGALSRGPWRRESKKEFLPSLAALRAMQHHEEAQEHVLFSCAGRKIERALCLSFTSCGLPSLVWGWTFLVRQELPFNFQGSRHVYHTRVLRLLLPALLVYFVLIAKGEPLHSFKEVAWILQAYYSKQFSIELVPKKVTSRLVFFV